MLIDPAWFTEEAVSAETREFVAEVRALLEQFPSSREMESPQAVRDFRRSGGGPYGLPVYVDWAERRTVPGPAGEIPIRVFAPEHIEAVYLHLHGGGWVIGAEDLSDPRNAALALATNSAVVSVGYRLAPEHKWPAGNDDCEAAARWLAGNAMAEFGTDRLLIGGESAGAHLAVTTMLRLRDKIGFENWLGANLVYGVYDLRETPSKRTNTVDPILSGAGMDWYGAHYLAGTPGETDLENPDISPVMADLSGMPPALFTIGTWDPLLDENLAMSTRWAAAGNVTDLAVYPGGIHAFDAFPWSMGDASREHMHSWLRSRIAASSR